MKNRKEFYLRVFVPLALGLAIPIPESVRPNVRPGKNIHQFHLGVVYIGVGFGKGLWAMKHRDSLYVVESAVPTFITYGTPAIPLHQIDRFLQIHPGKPQ